MHSNCQKQLVITGDCEIRPNARVHYTRARVTEDPAYSASQLFIYKTFSAVPLAWVDVSYSHKLISVATGSCEENR